MHTVVGTHNRERTTASKNKEQPLVVFFADALHHTLGISSRQRNIARKNKGAVFSGLVSLIAKVAAIRKLATPSRN